MSPKGSTGTMAKKKEVKLGEKKKRGKAELSGSG